MDMPMSSGSHSKIEIITGVQRRRRWTPEQKLAWVKRTTEPGMSVSLVAREPASAPANSSSGVKRIWKVRWWQSGRMNRWCPLQNCRLPRSASNSWKRHWDARRWRTRSSKKPWTLPRQKSGLRARQHYPGTSSKSRVLGPWCSAQPRVGTAQSTRGLAGSAQVAATA